MGIVGQDEIAEVFRRVEHWPLEARRTLFEMIGGSFNGNEVPRKPKGNFANLIGLLKTDGPPPTDEEIAQMLHDERMRRHGS